MLYFPRKPRLRSSVPIYIQRARSSSVLLTALPLLLVSPIPLDAQGPPSPPTPGCTLQKEVYTCNLQAFRRRLATAHTLGIETGSQDHFAAAELKHLIEQLGKALPSSPEFPADLTFVLVPSENPAIYLGPSDRPLGTLRVYAPGPNTTRGTLVWAEAVRGQPDQPWPATVHRLLQQFQTDLNRS